MIGRYGNQGGDHMVKSSGGKRIGVVSIDRKIDNPELRPFETLYEAVGKNTGNLMFTEAIFSILDGDIKRIGFSFDPEHVNNNFDIVVVPAANWINKNADWDWFLKILELLSIPVIVVGLGLQADVMELAAVEVSPSARRLAEFFARSAECVSVRGDFTKEWFNSIGLTNVVTTGCPSLYMNIFECDETIDRQKITLQATRYQVSDAFASGNSIARHLFEFSSRFRMPMVYQSEMEEIKLIVYGKSAATLGESQRNAILKLYGLHDIDQFDSYLRNYGRVFFDLKQWSDFVREQDGVIGTRLHGSILALNSGRPAVLIPHDSRTAEVASFAGIPTANGSTVRDMKSGSDLSDLLCLADMQKYKDCRSKNQLVFLQFLRDVGLAPRDGSIF